MKTQISFPELEEDLKAQLDTMTQKVRMDAAADGRKNLPGLDEDLEFYIESHHHGYNKLIALIYSTLQIGSKCIAVMESTQLYAETRKKLEDTERLVQERIIDVKQALKTFTRRVNVAWIYVVIALFLGLFDGLLNQPFFEFTGTSYWQSFSLAMLFGFGIFLIAHKAIPLILSIKDVQDKRRYLAVAGAVMFLLFLYMAEGRVKAAGITELIHASAFPYALASMVMFCLACVMSYFYHKSKNNKPVHSLARYQELKTELKALQKQLKDIDQERTDLNEKEKEEREYARALFEYATGLRQTIIEEAYQSYFAYKKINRLNRTDGGIPPCFHYPDYPFSFDSFVELSKEQPPFPQNGSGFAAACIVAMIVGFSSCTFSPDKPIVDASHIILVDPTDPLQVYPDSTQFMHLINLDKNIWQGVEVRFGMITDKDINPVETITLPKENRITGNLQERQELVSLFEHKALFFIDASRPKINVSMAHSIVYRSLARHLAVLEKSTATTKNLVVYSNLYENSDLANFYDKATFKKLQDHPKDMQQKFEDALPLSALTGITIWLVYQPIDYQDNLRFVIVSSFFKQMFVEHGATVNIVASL